MLSLWRAPFENNAFQVSRNANKYIDIQAPWALKKSDPDRMRTVLWVLVSLVKSSLVLSSSVSQHG